MSIWFVILSDLHYFLCINLLISCPCTNTNFHSQNFREEMAARRKERGKGPPKKGLLTVFILFFSVTGQGSKHKNVFD